MSSALIVNGFIVLNAIILIKKAEDDVNTLIQF